MIGPKRSSRFISSFKAIFKKEIIHIRHDPSVLVFAFVFPILELALLGYILDINPRQINTVIYDVVNTQRSKQFMDVFANSNDFKIIKWVSSDKEFYDAIVSGEAKVGIKVPIIIAKHEIAGVSDGILVVVDGSNATVAGEAVKVANRLGLQVSIQSLTGDALALPIGQVISSVPVESRISVLFNANSRSANFFLPGLIVWELPAITILLVVLTISREREIGTLEQLSITPIDPIGMILGKMLPYAIFAFILLCEILLVIHYVFDVPIRGSVGLLLLIAIPFIMASIGIGLMVSSAAKTQIEAVQLGVIFRVFPSFMFSGYIFPLESAKPFFEIMTRFVPERYFMEVCRGIVLRGATFDHLWSHTLILTIMSICTLSAAMAIYRKQLK